MTKYVIPRHAEIGTAAAEDDDVYFADCFVDTGLISRLLATNSARSVIVGRTGSGKSAIVRKISETHPHVCIIQPESLSLNFLADSWLLNVLTDQEFDLSLFYQQLWRHVIVIELLRYEKGLESEAKVRTFLSTIGTMFNDNSGKLRAFEYLTKFGGEFWEDTEQRVKHIANTFEKDFLEAMGANFAALKGKIEAGEKFTQSESIELVNNARKIVNRIQMQELSKIIDILDEHVFDDRKKQVVLLIDDLDKQWADERIRVKLIEALINVLPKFRKIKNVKIVVAMRDDLLDIVLAQATTHGFQREKFDDQHFRLKWSKEELLSILNRRINKLFKSQYTNDLVCIDDIMTTTVSGQNSIDYICDRTMMRPRDILSYFNNLLDSFGGKAMILQKDMRSIELDYSTSRRRALVDEWSDFYPYIDLLLTFLGHRNLSAEFRIGNIDQHAVDDLALNLVTKFEPVEDNLISRAKTHLNASCNETRNSFTESLISVLYRVGAIGIKTQSNSRMQFSFTDRPNIFGEELNVNTPCLIHPMLWQNLSRRGEAKDLFF
jgi:hypothetical protein